MTSRSRSAAPKRGCRGRRRRYGHLVHLARLTLWQNEPPILRKISVCSRACAGDSPYGGLLHANHLVTTMRTREQSRASAPGRLQRTPKSAFWAHFLLQIEILCKIGAFLCHSQMQKRKHRMRRCSVRDEGGSAPISLNRVDEPDVRSPYEEWRLRHAMGGACASVECAIGC